MDRDGDTLALMVTVPAEEWAFQRRRLTYLEAVVVQVLHDRCRLKEWFSASDLVAMQLPGLPQTRQGILRLANVEGWRRRVVTRRGGETYEFHSASLPGRAFDALVDRIVAAALDGPADELEEQPRPAPTAPPARPAAPVSPPDLENTTPPWVLPLLRVFRQSPTATLETALASLPQRYPAPTAEDARRTLERLGLHLGAGGVA